MWEFNRLCDEINAIDSAKIDLYNQKKCDKKQDKFVLHKHLGPCPFEGDINSAPVVLLLANPSSNAVEEGDHSAPTLDWPLWGLGPSASSDLHQWWSQRLGKLISEFGAQNVSKSVAALQLNPWASESFDRNLRLESRRLMFKVAASVIARSGILIVMRAKAQWQECKPLAEYELKIHARNPRCSYLTEGNLSAEAWKLVLSAIRNSATLADH